MRERKRELDVPDSEKTNITPPKTQHSKIPIEPPALNLVWLRDKIE